MSPIKSDKLLDGNIDVEEWRMLLCAVDVSVAHISGRDAARNRCLEGVARRVGREQDLILGYSVETCEECWPKHTRGSDAVKSLARVEHHVDGELERSGILALADLRDVGDARHHNTSCSIGNIS